jgi:KaiC/GvpD/RAD55 family RecA-like ATPase
MQRSSNSGCKLDDLIQQDADENILPIRHNLWTNDDMTQPLRRRPPRPSEMCITLGQFLEKEVPKSTSLLGDLIHAGSVGMLVAPRGCGKSLLAMTIGYAVAAPKKLEPWGWGSGTEVCLIDGEMREQSLQTRFRLLHARNTKEESIETVARNFHIISRDAVGDPIGSIDTPEGQEAFDEIIPNTAKLIIIDNLSALTSGGREDATSFALIKKWIIGKRLNGIAVLLVHHTGKAGTQRGSSVHEDLLDYSIQLSPREEPGKTAFTLRHTKLRDHLPELRGEFHGAFWTADDMLHFNIEAAEKTVRPEDEMILALHQQGLSHQKIASAVGLSKSMVQRRLKEIKATDLPEQSDAETDL